jgi:hypothetical protein
MGTSFSIADRQLYHIEGIAAAADTESAADDTIDSLDQKNDSYPGVFALSLNRLAFRFHPHTCQVKMPIPLELRAGRDIARALVGSYFRSQDIQTIHPHPLRETSDFSHIRSISRLSTLRHRRIQKMSYWSQRRDNPADTRETRESRPSIRYRL